MVSLLAALMVATAMVSGCGGGGASVQASTTTMGQELSDLKKAYDEGIISKKEYDKSRERILKRYK
jgi:ABC-type glycerol-3-phosphate transport system substrate-binding protein